MLRIVSLNMRAYFGPGGSQAEDFASLIASHDPDVVLLQEARPRWLEVVCRAAGLDGAHSLDVAPQAVRRRGDGCVIAVRSPLRIERLWRLEPSAFTPAIVATALKDPVPVRYEVLPDALAERFSTRALFAEVSGATRPFVAASFHATPGEGRVGKQKVSDWKPLFHGAAAIALSELDLPFVFAIDANEPPTETADAVRFGWEEGRPGAAKLAALLGLPPIHRARDLQREQLKNTGRGPGYRGISGAHVHHQWRKGDTRRWPAFRLDLGNIRVQDRELRHLLHRGVSRRQRPCGAPSRHHAQLSTRSGPSWPCD
jgi:hypothetical protein